MQRHLDAEFLKVMLIVIKTKTYNMLLDEALENFYKS